MTAILRLRSITCLAQAETFTDELFVTFNGTKRSLPDMTKGRTATLKDEFVFSGSRALSLFEDDGDHWYDGDDFIARHTITETPGDRTLGFSSTSGQAIGANYSIDVSVIGDMPAPRKALLRLTSITCLEQAETFTDELYVTFNGTKRSLPDMTQGQSKPLSLGFVFEGSPVLNLFENDGDHWYDRDDFIGAHVITQSPADVTLEFEATSGHGAPGHYEISITVTPVP